MTGVGDSEMRQAPPTPKKSLGQNFLVDDTHRDRIIADLTPPTLCSKSDLAAVC